jgi:four helix bundle protein
MDGQKSQADQLEERLISFASKIIQFSTELPKTPAGRHMAIQILRSGTSPASNYAEARGAESRADFIHKLGIVQRN